MDDFEYNGEFDAILHLPDIDLIGVVAGIQCADLLHQLHAEHPAEAVMERGRFAIRAVAACCAQPLDVYELADLTGCRIVDSRLFRQMLTATGPWSGELGYDSLRTYLKAVMIEGADPATLAELANVEPAEYRELARLLDLEDHWKELRMARVAMAALAGQPRRTLRRVGGLTWWRAHVWYRWGRDLRNAARQK